MAKLNNQLHDDILTNLEAGRLDEGYDFVFNIKKNAVADLFIAMLKKVLNKSKYAVRVRGSQADRKGKRDSGFHVTDSNVPLEHADRYRVYIDGIAQPVTKNDERIGYLQTVIIDVRKRNYRLQEDNNTLEGRVRGLAMNLSLVAGKLSSADSTINSLNFEIASMRKKMIELTPKAQPKNFAVMVNSNVSSEYAQLFAFRRGFDWNKADFPKRVRTVDHKYILFCFEDGKYNMYYDNSLGNADIQTIYDLSLESGVRYYVECLDNSAHFQMTADEIECLKSGKKLQCVKDIKDRTGLGLKESKAIADAWQNYNPEFFNVQKY